MDGSPGCPDRSEELGPTEVSISDAVESGCLSPVAEQLKGGRESVVIDYALQRQWTRWSTRRPICGVRDEMGIMVALPTGRAL